jgi:hypothetical protein
MPRQSLDALKNLPEQARRQVVLGEVALGEVQEKVRISAIVITQIASS